MVSVRYLYVCLGLAAIAWILAPPDEHSTTRSNQCTSGFWMSSINHCVENPIHIGEPMSFSSASAEHLTSLPRVGAVMAQRLIVWRNENSCETVKDLTKVRGVGPMTVAKWQGLLCCELDCQ